MPWWRASGQCARLTTIQVRIPAEAYSFFFKNLRLKRTKNKQKEARVDPGFLKKVTICKESLYAENFEFDSSVNPVQRTTDCKMFRGRKKETIVH